MSDTVVGFHYFNTLPFKIFGRGGVVRLYLVHNDIAFKETSYAFDGSWASENKEKVCGGLNPSGELPAAEIGSLVLSESNAIMRYVGNAFNKQRDALDIQAISDMVLDKVVPLRNSTIHALLTSDENEKKKHLEDRHRHYKILNTMLTRHGGETGEVGRASLQPSDFSVFCIIHDDSRIHGYVANQYPAVEKLYKRVAAVASVNKWGTDNALTPFPGL